MGEYGCGLGCSKWMCSASGTDNKPAHVAIPFLPRHLEPYQPRLQFPRTRLATKKQGGRRTRQNVCDSNRLMTMSMRLYLPDDVTNVPSTLSYLVCACV